MNQYTEYYWKIEKYKQNFEKMLAYMQTLDDFDQKLNFAMYLADYFVYHNTGYYVSSVLEKFFVDFAQSIKVDLSDIQYKKNSILHVLTCGYKTGGHTRVIERWIENAPANQIHSVIQLKPNRSNLIALENSVKSKNGEFVSLDNSLSVREKAIELRKMAMQYEYIILHTHMEDPIATIAFGSNDFTRPVLLYNHASHHPWIGKSIADLVLDIEKDDPVTKEKRGITNTYFLGVPAREISMNVPNKKEIREKLGLPTNKKIIVTCGSAARYVSIQGKHFLDYLIEIMDDHTCCYVIGVKPKNREWKSRIKKSGKDIKLLGYINFNEGFLDYLKSADLYLDSYPLCGGTATIDAISSGTPILSLKSVYPQFDYLTKTHAYCKTKEEFIYKAKKVLCDKNFSKVLYDELKKSLIEYQSIAAWNQKVENLYKIAPKYHCVKDISNIKEYSEPNDLSVLCNVINDKKFLKKKVELLSIRKIREKINYGDLYASQGVPFIFQVLSYKKLGVKMKVFKLFGIKIFSYVKKKM